mgnify:CR=1 FL=1
MEGEHHFDAACLAPLHHLTALSLSEFSSASLAHLPAGLRQLQVLALHNEPVRLPAGLQLTRLELAGSTM